VIRNLAVDGTPFGPRHRGMETLYSSARELAATIGSWVIGSGSGGRAAVTIGVVAVLGAAAATVFAAKRGFVALLTPAVLVVLYAGYVVLVAWQSALDAIGDRLLAPAFVPMLVIVAWAAEQLLRRFSGSWSVVVALGVSATLVGLLVIEARDDHALVQRAFASELGLVATRDHDAGLARAVERLDPSVMVVSNDPYRLWVASGRDPVRLAPARHLYRSTEVQHQIPQLLRAAACRSVMLAWFDDEESSFVSPEALRDHLRTELVETGDGWALYRLGPVVGSECVR